MFFACSAFACAFIPEACAQNPAAEAIRVESNEVLIPVLVVDKARLRDLHNHPEPFDPQVNDGDFHSWEAVPVRNLTANNFEVFEDGQRQTIKSVTPEEHEFGPLLRDNVREYAEAVGPGGGIWIAPKWSGGGTLLGWPAYVVAYIPPPSASGTCHDVAVKVNRRNSLVFSRSEFCNVSDSAADPLAGTKKEKRLTSELSSAKKGAIPLSAVVFAPLATERKSRVRIFLKLPLELRATDCASASGTVDVLGAVYSGDGVLSARFSDREYLNGGGFSLGGESLYGPAGQGQLCILTVPTRYETQLTLVPGEYDLRIVLSDGRKFGRAEAHFNVERYGGNQVAISSIVLVRHYLEVTADSAAATKLPSVFTPLISKGIEVTPTANRQFSANETLHFYFEVYEPSQTGSAPTEVEAHLRIVDAKTGQVVKTLKPVDAATYAKPGDPVIPIGGGIDITSLAKGSYLLEAQATDSSGNSTSWRNVNFTIVK